MNELQRKVQINLQKAKALLVGDVTLVTVGESTAISCERGIKPIMRFIDEGISIKGAFVADKVVGKAAALLYCYCQIQALYACTITRTALALLGEYGIFVQYEVLTECIVNRKGDAPCPMELAVSKVWQPTEAVVCLRQALKNK